MKKHERGEMKKHERGEMKKQEVSQVGRTVSDLLQSKSSRYTDQSNF